MSICRVITAQWMGWFDRAIARMQKLGRRVEQVFARSPDRARESPRRPARRRGDAL